MIRPFRRSHPDPLRQRYRESLEEAEDAQSRLDERARRAEGFVPKTELRLDLLDRLPQARSGMSTLIMRCALGFMALWLVLVWLVVWLTTS